MNILYINDFAPNFPGSFFESLYALSSRLKKENHNLYFIFPLERAYIKRLDELGSVYYCPSFLGKKFDLGLLKLVYSICKEKKIDTVHSNFGFGGPVTATLLSKVLNFQHIAHERSLSNNYSINNINFIKKYRAKVLFKLLQVIGNTSYIAISSGVKESLENYNGISSGKITVIPNAVLTNRSNKNNDNQKLNNLKKIKASGKFIVGMTAHLGPQKDHKTLVDAVEIVISKKANTYFMLIGGNLVSDKDDFRSQLEKYIKDKKLDDYFKFIGEVQNPMPYVELFDVGCLISNWEGFGNALVEYMLKKKPVIGTAVGGIKDIIDDGVNGLLVPPKEPAVLAEKIIHLIENPKRATEMGAQAHKKAISEYDMDRWVDRIIKVYEAAV